MRGTSRKGKLLCENDCQEEEKEEGTPGVNLRTEPRGRGKGKG